MEDKKLIFFPPTEDCPVRNVLSRLGDKWSMLVLTTLQANGTMRFSQLTRTIGDISQRMLSVTLRSLEADGLVSRTVYPEVPPRVEYGLTPRGESLMPCLGTLVEWAVENIADIQRSREKFAVKICV